MSPDRKSSTTIPLSIALACAVIICVILGYSLITGLYGTAPVTHGTSPVTSQNITPSGDHSAAGTLLVIPAGVCSVNLARPTLPVVPVTYDNATLYLTSLAPEVLVPYTDRGFSEEGQAAISWWIFPGFDDANREYRRYMRGSAEEQRTYPPEEQRFFTFITNMLDRAEQQSVLTHETRLFRGITPSVAGLVLNSSEWREAPFASTAYDITVTLDSYGTRDAGGYLNVLVLQRHMGDQAIYANEDQREFLLPRNTAWNVVKTENIRTLTVNADFALHNRTETSASFHNVRLIYLRDAGCIA